MAAYSRVETFISFHRLLVQALSVILHRRETLLHAWILGVSGTYGRIATDLSVGGAAQISL